MKKLALSIVLLFLFCLSSQAQGLYKINYQVSRTVNYQTYTTGYEGLLIWYGSAQPILRTRFYHHKLQKYIVVQQNVAYIPGVMGEGYLKGSNVSFIVPPPVGEGYSPDTFVFQRVNGYYACTDIFDEANQRGSVQEFRPLMPNEITNTLLQNFGFSPPSNVSTGNSSNVTMHLIVVADVEDRNIGEAGKVDVQGIGKEFQAAANEIGVKVKSTYIADSNFSRTTVVNFINNDLKPGSNDIVVFVYTGHGFRFDNDSDPYPRFSLTRNRQSPVENNLSASEVYNSIKRKGARLNITIVDACNSKIGIDKPNYNEGVVLKPSDAGISRSAVASLFLNTRGNILMAAATKGEYALSSARIGGFFIHSFLDAFMYETSIANGSSPSWVTIFSKAKSYASDKTGGRQTAIYDTDMR